MMPIPTIIAITAFHTFCPNGAAVYNDAASVVHHGTYRVSGNDCSAVVTCDPKHILVFRGNYDGPLDSPALCSKWLHRPLVRLPTGSRPGHPCIVTKLENRDCDYTKPADKEKLDAADIVRHYPNSR